MKKHIMKTKYKLIFLKSVKSFKEKKKAVEPVIILYMLLYTVAQASHFPNDQHRTLLLTWSDHVIGNNKTMIVPYYL